MHVIGYVRVSTEEQERSGLGVEAQTDTILTECKGRGWTVELMSDLGASGKHVNPQLRKALDLLSSGQPTGWSWPSSTGWHGRTARLSDHRRCH